MDQSFMKERKILPLVLSMSLPMVISMAVNALYNIVDSYFVAKLSEEAMTALALVYPIQNLITAIGVGIGIGINAGIAYYLGAKKQTTANQIATQGIALSVLHGILLTVLCTAGLWKFLKGFSADLEVNLMAITYGNRVLLFSVVITLGITFEKMQHSLNDNLQSILELSLTEERLKYQLLQSQINPHFLYNILGSIQTCQSLGKLDIANQMLTNLTRFYRMTLRKSKDLISIRDELTIAQLYLEMEKLCHNDNLTWEINMEDGIDNFLICKFTLQPFLENSILHGLSQKTPEVHISIDLSYGDDTVIIVITDNGIGMAKEQLLELQKTLDEKIVNYEKHFGIGNVNKRISNPYFGNGGISVESCLYEGTSITIEFDQMEKYDEECNDCR